MASHVVFLKDEPLREILAGRKRFEFRLSYRGLACGTVREGDLLLLKRVGGEVEAACDVGNVCLYRDLPPAEVAELARRYADGVSAPYFERYVPPRNTDHPVNVAVIGLSDVREALIPPEKNSSQNKEGVGGELRCALAQPNPESQLSMFCAFVPTGAGKSRSAKSSELRFRALLGGSEAQMSVSIDSSFH